MPNFCPSCGTKSEEGYKFCLSCGAKLQPENIDDSNKPEEKVAPAPPQQQPTAQESVTPVVKPRKSNKALYYSLIAIIAVIIIIIVIVIMFSGGGLFNNIDNRFVGEWEQDDELMPISWNFKDDGSFEMMDLQFGKWSVHGNQLCITPNSQWDDFSTEVCYNFEFSDSGNTVTLSIDGSETFVLIKK